jgi:hypothetical protein
MTRAQFVAAFAALGYRVGADYADSIARYMQGSRAGDAYPARAFPVFETDTGRSAFHFESRRDANFRAMQELRQTAYYVGAGRICEC